MELRRLFARLLAGAALGVAAVGGVGHSARAEDNTFVLTLQDHKFSTTRLELPAGVKIKLIVRNLDKTPEEFESVKLNREKVIPGGGEIVVFLGPLSSGTYDFFGEFHRETATGEIVVK